MRKKIKKFNVGDFVKHKDRKILALSYTESNVNSKHRWLSDGVSKVCDIDKKYVTIIHRRYDGFYKTTHTCIFKIPLMLASEFLEITTVTSQRLRDLYD